jgi:hypothetical protein
MLVRIVILVMVSLLFVNQLLISAEGYKNQVIMDRYERVNAESRIYNNCIQQVCLLNSDEIDCQYACEQAAKAKVKKMWNKKGSLRDSRLINFD